jgi:predicted amidophosphoribosyltransferase
MSIHLHYQPKCLTCGEDYLPFNEENRNCPKCGTPAKQVAPLIPDVLRAATYKNRWGVFGVFSTGDHYVSMAMQ